MAADRRQPAPNKLESKPLDGEQHFDSGHAWPLFPFADALLLCVCVFFFLFSLIPSEHPARGVDEGGGGLERYFYFLLPFRSSSIFPMPEPETKDKSKTIPIPLHRSVGFSPILKVHRSCVLMVRLPGGKRRCALASGVGRLAFYRGSRMACDGNTTYNNDDYTHT